MKRNSQSWMLLFVAVASGIVKRLGFAKLFTRIALTKMLSPDRGVRVLSNYEPTEHDVFVATFGKSGTNWMMQISQQISHYGEAEFEHIHDLVAWPEAPGPGPISIDDPGPQANSPTGLRIIKTHLPADSVPYSEKSTYLTVIRDPKEVLVSSYYFLGAGLGVLSHLSIDDWYELTMMQGALMERWAVHTASFWNWRDRPNVLVTNFGGIKREPRESLEQVVEVMGVQLTPAQFDQVLERSSFPYMKAHESQFSPPKLPFAKEGPLMIRRGESGSSDELLSRTQQAAIDRCCMKNLAELDSDFPYTTAFDVVEGAAN
ncbi:MAG: sulfotransferase domain-containing protein [Myxococcota bacterium]